MFYIEESLIITFFSNFSVLLLSEICIKTTNTNLLYIEESCLIWLKNKIKFNPQIPKLRFQSLSMIGSFLSTTFNERKLATTEFNLNTIKFRKTCSKWLWSTIVHMYLLCSQIQPAFHDRSSQLQRHIYLPNQFFFYLQKRVILHGSHPMKQNHWKPTRQPQVPQKLYNNFNFCCLSLNQELT